MKKRNLTLLLLITATLATLPGCTSSVSLTNVWSAPDHQPGSIDKILVVGLAHREEMRSIFEYQLRFELTNQGVAAMASIDGLPTDEALSRETFDAYFQDADIDAVLITGLVSADTLQKYVPGESYTMSTGYYDSWHGYYTTRYNVYHDPGYLTTSTEYMLESNLYETAGGKLIWRAISKAVDPEHAMEVIEELSKMLVYQLREDGLIKLK
jgi:hypothetical protein